MPKPKTHNVGTMAQALIDAWVATVKDLPPQCCVELRPAPLSKPLSREDFDKMRALVDALMNSRQVSADAETMGIDGLLTSWPKR